MAVAKANDPDDGEPHWVNVCFNCAVPLKRRGVRVLFLRSNPHQRYGKLLLNSDNWVRWLAEGWSLRELMFALLQFDREAQTQARATLANTKRRWQELADKATALTVVLFNLWKGLGRPDVRAWDRQVAEAGVTHAELLAVVRDRFEGSPELGELARLRAENQTLREAQERRGTLADQSTTLGGSVTATAPGPFALSFVSQFDFETLEFKATGTPGVQLATIRFGDDTALQTVTGGIDISLLPSGGFLKGRKIPVGAIVTVSAIAGRAGDVLSVAIEGVERVGGFAPDEDVDEDERLLELFRVALDDDDDDDDDDDYGDELFDDDLLYFGLDDDDDAGVRIDDDEIRTLDADEHSHVARARLGSRSFGVASPLAPGSGSTDTEDP